MADDDNKPHVHQWTPVYDSEGVEIIGRVCMDTDCQAHEGRLS